MEKSAKVYDYQARAREFKVNDWVVPFGANPLEVGRITQVWPGIAQADVEFSHTSKRYPVEDLKKINKVESEIIPPETVSIPGGRSLTPVSAGPEAKETINQGYSTYHPTLTESLARKASVEEMAEKVAGSFLEKKGLYWHKADRNYRSTKTEQATNKYCCPKKGCTADLKKAVYKRLGGKSDHLFVCPNCLFMVKDVNIHRDQQPEPPQVDPPVPDSMLMPPQEHPLYIQELMAGDGSKKALDIEADWSLLGKSITGAVDGDSVEISYTIADYTGSTSTDLTEVLAGLDQAVGSE